MPLRRRVLLALAGAPFAALADVPPLPGLRRWGSGAYRRFGLLVYEATLWAGEVPLNPPLALCLHYRRHIAGSVIAEASIAEMRKLGCDETLLAPWGATMSRLFPDVKPDDRIVGLYLPDRAIFSLNGRPLGEIAQPAFSRWFFGIWLDPRTSAPELRSALLRQGA